MGVAFNRSFFVLTPVWPSQDLPTFSNNCAFLQPVMQGENSAATLHNWPTVCWSRKLHDGDVAEMSSRLDGAQPL